MAAALPASLDLHATATTSAAHAAKLWALWEQPALLLGGGETVLVPSTPLEFSDEWGRQAASDAAVPTSTDEPVRDEPLPVLTKRKYTKRAPQPSAVADGMRAPDPPPQPKRAKDQPVGERCPESPQKKPRPWPVSLAKPWGLPGFPRPAGAVQPPNAAPVDIPAAPPAVSPPPPTQRPPPGTATAAAAFPPSPYPLLLAADVKPSLKGARLHYYWQGEGPPAGWYEAEVLECCNLSRKQGRMLLLFSTGYELEMTCHALLKVLRNGSLALVAPAPE